MQREVELTISPATIHDRDYIMKQGAKVLGMPLDRIEGFVLRKRSIDARAKRVVYRLKVLFFIDEPVTHQRHERKINNVHNGPVVLIVGAGPAGLFAAFRCLELGFKPIVIERGKDVRERRRDLASINREGKVNPESNYCFGEGGAGTYSDGKLYTRSDKRGDVQKVLSVFVEHGASPDILVDARPHIGTNKLPHIIQRIRERIIEQGGEVLFNTKVTDILAPSGKVEGVMTDQGVIPGAHVILATGHSARDVYRLFAEKKWLLEAKPLAIGVRIEHPQALIDQAQYHCMVRPENLPPAYYSLVHQVDQRGVFSFCMCPGGVIAPCSTGPEEIVVNGWSPSKRNNPHANSGTVVQVELADIPGGGINPMAMLDFQSAIEQRAFSLGGGDLIAPAQRLVDFVEKKVSVDLPQTSYKPGTRSVEMREVLPEFISSALERALPVFGEKMKGYYTNEAVLVGVESRTSSPLRIPRDRHSLQHPQVSGLYPCAEGAGYAGGIVSAAIDGMNCADAISRVTGS